ncbi:zinc finger, CCHC-type containing protein [Tanacetum coccineum]
METILKAHGLWKTIDTKDAVDEKKAHTSKAMIFQTLPEDVLMQVAQCSTTKEVWDSIKVLFIGVDLVQKARSQTLRSELESLKMKESETISGFASKLSSIRAKFRNLGTTLESKIIVRKLLNSVPKKFLPIVATIEQYQDLDEMSFEEAVGRLTAFEVRIKSQDTLEANDQDKLLLASSNNQSHGKGRSKNFNKEAKESMKWKNSPNARGTSTNQGTKDKSTLRCYKCGDFGHFARESVQILEVHLEHWQSISFRARLPLRSIVSNDGRKKTTLTEWLEYNDANEDGRHLTYLYFIKGFVWYGDSKMWRPRKRGQGLIGRLTHVHPSAGELFYLRMLLCHHKGRSFEEIHTFNHRMYSTFWVACEALGLLHDDKAWNPALEEASFTSSAAELRSLFAQILIYCEVLNLVKLWNKIKSASYIKSDDIPLTTSKVLCIQNLYMNDPKLQGGVLFELEIIIDNYSKTITNFGLPALSRRLQAKLKNKALMEEKSYDRVELSQEDESPMNDRRCFKTLNRTLSDILDILDTLFGDYFASWLLDIGDGNIGEPAEDDNQSSSWIRIPEKYCIQDDDDGLLKLIVVTTREFPFKKLAVSV